MHLVVRQKKKYNYLTTCSLCLFICILIIIKEYNNVCLVQFIVDVVILSVLYINGFAVWQM